MSHFKDALLLTGIFLGTGTGLLYSEGGPVLQPLLLYILAAKTMSIPLAEMIRMLSYVIFIPFFLIILPLRLIQRAHARRSRGMPDG